MPVHFDWRSLQQYALPALGIVSLLVSAIIAVAGGLGLGGSSSENDNADANVIFKVVDQHGMPRVCLLIPTISPHDDKARYNNHDGTYPIKAKPGQTVTAIFSCNRAQGGCAAPGGSIRRRPRDRCARAKSRDSQPQRAIGKHAIIITR